MTKKVPDPERRAAFIANVRAFADWLEEHPSLPVPVGMESASVHMNANATDSPDQSLAALLEFAEQFGAELDESLDDRTRATVKIGQITYKQLVWHNRQNSKDAELARLHARVAELEAERLRPTALAPDFNDGPCQDPDCPNASWLHHASADLAAADPTGLAYTRADDEADDPTPVSPARVEPHYGAVVDGSLVPAPIAAHYDASNWRGEATEVADITCACGRTFSEHGRVAGAVEALRRHIDGGALVDETEDPDATVTGAAVTDSCVFVGDKGGWCETHKAVHIASGVGECGCPVYPFAGRGDAADTIIDHRRDCSGHPYASAD